MAESRRRPGEPLMLLPWIRRTSSCCCDYLLEPILNILVLHTEHVPSMAGRPFFMVTCFALLISRWVLHFMQ
jgi:hypothetical protein